MPARDCKKKLTTLRLLLFINLPSLQRGLFLVAFVASVGFPNAYLFLGGFSSGDLGPALLTGIRWMATEFQLGP
jgi:hypothetical protein